VLQAPVIGSAVPNSTMPIAAWPTRSVSSYCTDDCVSPQGVDENTGAINAFSTTSYYVTIEGELADCNSEYPACNWTSMGSVDVFNAAVQAETGAFAQPLLFSNSGDMVQAFRALWTSSDGIGRAASFLADRVAAFNYSRVQLDLEPSCWAASPTECDWPNSTDAHAYVELVNASADALAPLGSGVAVCVGNWPGGQCDPSNYTSCEAAGDAYVHECESGAWDMGACNCCAYVRFYALTELCASRAELIVNMDTYQNAPFNQTAFEEAVEWYTSHGCPPERTGIGLLTGEATDSSAAAAVLAAARAAGAMEIDIWANLWTQPEALATWDAPLRTFLSASSDEQCSGFWMPWPQAWGGSPRSPSSSPPPPPAAEPTPVLAGGASAGRHPPPHLRASPAASVALVGPAVGASQICVPVWGIIVGANGLCVALAATAFLIYVFRRAKRRRAAVAFSLLRNEAGSPVGSAVGWQQRYAGELRG